jgi:hypothetical protein
MIQSDLIAIKTLINKFSTNNTEANLVMSALNELGLPTNDTYTTVKQMTEGDANNKPVIMSQKDRDDFIRKYNELKATKDNQEATLAKGLTDLADKFNKDKFSQSDYQELTTSEMAETFELITDVDLKEKVRKAYEAAIPKEYYDEIFK